MLDRPVAKIGLDCSGIDAVIGQLEAAGVAQHVRVDLHIEPSSLTSALDHRLKARLVNGVPRSDVNTNGDFDSCSRCSRRRARNSLLVSGWVAGLPFLSLAPTEDPPIPMPVGRA